MLTALYNALWYPVLPFALLATGATKVDARERLGRTRADAFDANSFRLWIHAASVGEIEAVRSIATGLQRDIPGIGLVVTAMTSGGRQAARRRLPAAAHHLLAPLDCPATVRAFLRNFRPNLVLIAETELWPNFFREAARAKAKIAIVNGRLSERSMRRYRLARSLFASALALADLILVQTAEDAARYVSLGAPRELIRITGNTKFDVEVVPANLRPALQNFARECPILVAGSTAPGEERMVLTAYAHLVERFPWLALVTSNASRKSRSSLMPRTSITSGQVRCRQTPRPIKQVPRSFFSTRWASCVRSISARRSRLSAAAWRRLAADKAWRSRRQCKSRCFSALIMKTSARLATRLSKAPADG
jgi:3-deoxy-D-manno-octulosonic-acid transferase